MDFVIWLFFMVPKRIEELFLEYVELEM